MSGSWVIEFWRVVGLLFIALLFGIGTGHVAAWLLLMTLVYLGYHLYQLRKFEKWLQSKGRAVPEPHGVWGDVYYQLYRLQRRNRKRKKRLAAMLGRFRESTAAMPDATVVLDQNGLIEWWNDAAARGLGLKLPHDVGQPITNLVRHPDLLRYLESGDYSEALIMPSPVDDRVTLSVRIVPYGNNQRLLVARDITRLQLLEQMRRDFIANVSHELRTPLTVISGYLETIQDSDEDCTKEWAHSVDAMQQQTARMQQIVTDLLLLSKLETEGAQSERYAVDVPALLSMLKEDAEVLSKGAHTVELDAESGLWLLGSRGELRSAFSNLIYNAVRYTPPGGKIRIRWYADERGAHFEVADTGIGIAAQHIPRLTERFYRVDVGRSREAGGTGLGLAIVKHVLMRHDARLTVESRPGAGSVFACHFPAELIAHEALLREQQQ